MVNVFGNEAEQEFINYTWTPSDKKYWDVYYEQYEYDGVSFKELKRIEAILCKDFIESWDASDSIKSDATAELVAPN